MSIEKRYYTSDFTAAIVHVKDFLVSQKREVQRDSDSLG